MPLPVDDVVKEAGLWLLRNFPAAVVVGLLLQLRSRWSALLHDVKVLRRRVQRMMEKHASRHPEDGADLWRDEEDGE